MQIAGIGKVQTIDIRYLAWVGCSWEAPPLKIRGRSFVMGCAHFDRQLRPVYLPGPIWLFWSSPQSFRATQKTRHGDSDLGSHLAFLRRDQTQPKFSNCAIWSLPAFDAPLDFSPYLCVCYHIKTWPTYEFNNRFCQPLKCGLDCQKFASSDPERF